MPLTTDLYKGHSSLNAKSVKRLRTIKTERYSISYVAHKLLI